ncbi:uncharacterized protein J3R85_000373 [Psidium guajava]|nr:uncharacterized protein J3R85_000373 [Psidium guajava]
MELERCRQAECNLQGRRRREDATNATMAARTFAKSACSGGDVLGIKCNIADENLPSKFGIYAQAMPSDIAASRNFFSKSFCCLWWGLQNLIHGLIEGAIDSSSVAKVASIRRVLDGSLNQRTIDGVENVLFRLTEPVVFRSLQVLSVYG